MPIAIAYAIQVPTAALIMKILLRFGKGAAELNITVGQVDKKPA